MWGESYSSIRPMMITLIDVLAGSVRQAKTRNTICKPLRVTSEENKSWWMIPTLNRGKNRALGLVCQLPDGWALWSADHWILWCQVQKRKRETWRWEEEDTKGFNVFIRAQTLFWGVIPVPPKSLKYLNTWQEAMWCMDSLGGCFHSWFEGLVYHGREEKSMEKRLGGRHRKWNCLPIPHCTRKQRKDRKWGLL